MQFDWDENKASINHAKPGISFEEAQTVFDDPLFVDFYDPDHSYDESRYLNLSVISPAYIGLGVLERFSIGITGLIVCGRQRLGVPGGLRELCENPLLAYVLTAGKEVFSQSSPSSPRPQRRPISQ